MILTSATLAILLALSPGDPGLATLRLVSDTDQAGHTPDITLLQAHFLCEEAARDEPLGMGTVRFCSSVFQIIKLGFIPGLTPSEYAALSPAEKARVNREGYAAWRNWVENNPRRVAQLRHQAYTVRGGSSA